MRCKVKVKNLGTFWCQTASIICVLCLSKKKHTFDNIKLNKDDFNITKITYKLKADSTMYAQRIFKSEDPKELFIGINEFYWNILKNRF